MTKPARTELKKPHNIVLRLLGPGLVTGAADDDPSGIATYAQAGSNSSEVIRLTRFNGSTGSLTGIPALQLILLPISSRQTDFPGGALGLESVATTAS